MRTEELAMTLAAGPAPYLHERYFGRPCCPKCGELMMAPEYPEFTECVSGDEIRHFWACDSCDNRFATLVKFKPMAA
jgi:hypothetical protein